MALEVQGPSSPPLPPMAAYAQEPWEQSCCPCPRLTPTSRILTGCRWAPLRVALCRFGCGLCCAAGVPWGWGLWRVTTTPRVPVRRALQRNGTCEISQKRSQCYGPRCNIYQICTFGGVIIIIFNNMSLISTSRLILHLLCIPMQLACELGGWGGFAKGFLCVCVCVPWP